MGENKNNAVCSEESMKFICPDSICGDVFCKMARTDDELPDEEKCSYEAKDIRRCTQEINPENRRICLQKRIVYFWKKGQERYRRQSHNPGDDVFGAEVFHDVRIGGKGRKVNKIRIVKSLASENRLQGLSGVSWWLTRLDFWVVATEIFCEQGGSSLFGLFERIVWMNSILMAYEPEKGSSKGEGYNSSDSSTKDIVRFCFLRREVDESNPKSKQTVTTDK